MQKEEQHMSSLVGVTFHEKRIFYFLLSLNVIVWAQQQNVS